MNRIAIVGTSCAGKSTLSKKLEARLGYKRIELDEINWMPNWQERDFAEFTEIVEQATRAETWITDGNYGSRLGTLLFDRADTIIWLNLPFLVVYGRLFRRQFRRVVLGEELWSGNRETLRQALFEKDSLIYFIPRTWRQRQKKLRQFFCNPPAGKTLIEFTSERDVNRWVAQLNDLGTSSVTE